MASNPFKICQKRWKLDKVDKTRYLAISSQRQVRLRLVNPRAPAARCVFVLECTCAWHQNDQVYFFGKNPLLFTTSIFVSPRHLDASFWHGTMGFQSRFSSSRLNAIKKQYGKEFHYFFASKNESSGTRNCSTYCSCKPSKAKTTRYSEVFRYIYFLIN